MRGVCALNGMIRNTGVKTIASTITMSTNNESQRIFLLGMRFSSSPLYLPDHRHRPQHADRQKRKEIDEQIPATIARWRSFDCGDCFRVSDRKSTRLNSSN